MTLQTKYNEKDTVWVLNPKTAKAVKRTIVGIRTQSVFGLKKTIYAFVKDWCTDKETPEVTDCFWLSEEKVFKTREELTRNF